MSPRRILVIRLSSIGDILLTSPFLRQINLTFPQAEIDYIVKKEFEELIRYNPYINKIHIFDSSGEHSLKQLKKALKQRKYDYIFDLHNNFRSVFLRSGLSSSYQGIVKKDKFRQMLLLCFKLNFYQKPKPISQRYLETGLKTGIADDHQGLQLFWSDIESKNAGLILDQLNFKKTEKYICLAPGAGYFTKRWPVEYFAKLIELIHTQLKLKIIILGGTGDKEIATELVQMPYVYNLAGQISLLETAVILSRGAVLVSNDTGLMHMSAAVQTPVIAIFGSSVVEWGFEPFRIPHILLEEKGLYCRPCSHIGRNSCPQKHFKCMRNISPQHVFDALKSILKTE